MNILNVMKYRKIAEAEYKEYLHFLLSVSKFHASLYRFCCKQVKLLKVAAAHSAPAQ